MCEIESVDDLVQLIKTEAGVEIDAGQFRDQGLTLQHLMEQPEELLPAQLLAMDLPPEQVALVCATLTNIRIMGGRAPATPPAAAPAAPAPPAAPAAAPARRYHGLVNQGATCYLNSLLQAYYHLPAFRRAVCAIATEGDPAKNAAVAAQRLFYDMTCGNGPARTHFITQSLQLDPKVMMDAEEINGRICDVLEELEERAAAAAQPAEQTSATPGPPSPAPVSPKTRALAAGQPLTIKQLFSGKYRDVVTCDDHNFTAHLEETPFRCMALEVKDCSSIDDSFLHARAQVIDQYEVADNEGNKNYFRATKATYWYSMPPVLFLHLKRFVYDRATRTLQKIMNEYKFPTQLDLSKYVYSDTADDHNYSLYAVLVHQGDQTACGHYICFVKTAAGAWTLFNDEQVTTVTEAAAVEGNYSGQSSAYLLMYLRDDCREQLLSEGEAALPNALLSRLFGEDAQALVATGEPAARAAVEAEERKEREELERRHSAYCRVAVQVATPRMLHLHEDQLGVLDFAAVPATHCLTAQRTDTVAALAARLAAAIGEVAEFGPAATLWAVQQTRPNGPWVPRLVPSPDTPLSALVPREATADNTPQLRVFVDPEPLHLHEEEVLLFFKTFDTETQSLRYVGRHVVSVHAPLVALQDMLGAGREFHVWWEHADGDIRGPLTLGESLQALGLQHAEVLVWEDITHQRERQNAALLNARRFLELSRDREPVSFAHVETPTDVACKLALSPQATYAELQAAVHRHLRLPGECGALRFRCSSAGLPFPMSQFATLRHLLARCGDTKKLYFESLERPPSTAVFEVMWSVPEQGHCERIPIELPEACLGDLVERVRSLKGAADLLVYTTEGPLIGNLLTEYDAPVSTSTAYQFQTLPPPMYEETAPLNPESLKRLFAVYLRRGTDQEEPLFPAFLWYVRAGQIGAELRADIQHHMPALCPPHGSLYIRDLQGILIDSERVNVVRKAAELATDYEEATHIFWHRSLVICPPAVQPPRVELAAAQSTFYNPPAAAVPPVRRSWQSQANPVAQAPAAKQSTFFTGGRKEP